MREKSSYKTCITEDTRDRSRAAIRRSGHDTWWMIAFRSVDWIGLDWSGLPRLFFPRIARSVTTRPNAANWPVLDRYPSQLLWPGWSAEGHLDSHAAYMYAPWNSVVMALGVSWRLVDDETRHKTTPCMLSRASRSRPNRAIEKRKRQRPYGRTRDLFLTYFSFNPRNPIHPALQAIQLLMVSHSRIPFLPSSG